MVILRHNPSIKTYCFIFGHSYLLRFAVHLVVRLSLLDQLSSNICYFSSEFCVLGLSIYIYEVEWFCFKKLKFGGNISIFSMKTNTNLQVHTLSRLIPPIIMWFCTYSIYTIHHFVIVLWLFFVLLSFNFAYVVCLKSVNVRFFSLFT